MVWRSETGGALWKRGAGDGSGPGIRLPTISCPAVRKAITQEMTKEMTAAWNGAVDRVATDRHTRRAGRDRRR
jgi:hypothetical protein